ncbi:glycosyltransferase family 2 protein [Flavobacterium wongokense]|uniref:glycosyltransferase family 2 protein n=1 Tax=Flavobacterium wongokense TaxID=2910674 RepID=UPI001F2B007A|nr:glycosyltransferase [Flavobacterium sp. WG47]MCF6132677.1 glycosyltransferase [Flavobacterium sp. WG47]
MKLAIVIPYYKLAYFEETLQSLSNQTNADFNIYVGDDASPESPSTVLSKFDKLNLKYKRFEQNLGATSLTKQWERCLQMTENEDWVMILGDDDVLGENVVKAFYDSIETINKNSCNVVRFATQKIDNDSRIISDIYSHPEIEKSASFLTRLYTEWSRSSLSEYIFNKKLLQQKGIIDFPVAWHSDIALVLELSDFREVFSINDAIVQVRVSQNSISGSSSFIKQKAKADAAFADYLIKNLDKFSKEEREVVVDRIERMALNNRKQFKFGVKVMLLHLGKLDFSRTFSFIYKSLKK